MNNKFKELIKFKSDKELCGFILKDGSIISVDNISDDPFETFMIHPKEYLKHKKNIEYIFHTHPKKGPPSKEDILHCKRINIPFAIVSENIVFVIHPGEKECLQFDYMAN